MTINMKRCLWAATVCLAVVLPFAADGASVSGRYLTIARSAYAAETFGAYSKFGDRPLSYARGDFADRPNLFQPNNPH